MINLFEQRDSRFAAAMFDAVVDTLPGGIALYRLGDTLSVDYIGDGIAHVLGYPKEEIETTHDRGFVFEYVYEDDMPVIDRLIRRAREERGPVNGVFRVRRKDGELIWLEVSARPVAEEDGEQLYCAVFTQPVKEAALFRTLATDTQTAILVAQVDDAKILYANDAWRVLQHVPDDLEIIGTSPNNLSDSSLRIIDEKGIESLSYDDYVSFHRERGDGTHLAVNAKLIDWNEKKAFILYVYDVTAEYQAQEQLNALLDKLPGGVAIFSVSPEGKVAQTYINDGYYSMIGSTREQRAAFTGTSLMGAVKKEDRNNISACVAKLLSGQETAHVTYRALDGEGGWMWLLLHLAVVDRSDEGLIVYANYSDVTEESKTRIELLENKAILEMALKMSKVSVGRLDIPSRSMRLSREVANDLALPTVLKNVPESVIEQGHIYPSDIPAVRAMFEKVYAGRAASGEIRQRFGDDDDFKWTYLSYVPLPDQNGDCLEVVSASIDIHERKLRENRYKDQLALHDSLTEKSIASILTNLSQNEVITLSGGIDGVVDKGHAETMDELCDQVCSKICDEEDRSEFESRFFRAKLIASYAVGVTHDDMRCRIEGYAGWIELSYDIVQNPSNGDLEAFLSVTDATDAARSDLLIQTIVKVGYENVFTFDAHTGMPHNTASMRENELVIERQKRLDNPEEGVKAFLREYCADDDIERVLEENDFGTINEALKHNPFHLSHYSVWEGDEIHRKRCLYTLMQRDPDVIVCAVQDVTDQWDEEARRKEELERALNDANAANDAKTVFLSNMSHEIRTPMNAILGITHLAGEVPDNPEQTIEYLGELQNAGQHLLSVLNDVLDVGRIESGRLELHPDWTPVHDLFKSCIDMIEPVMQEHEIIFHHPPMSKASDFEYYIDVLRMRQVYMNLLSNAAKFTPRGGEVWLETKHVCHDDHRTKGVIIVRDSGCGMSEEFLSHVFEPFEREENPSTGLVEGTGLGLTISKNIIEAMGGTLTVESELGKGSCFTITLEYEYRKGEIAPVESSSCEVRLSGRRVMLVDDNHINRIVARRLLQSRGLIVEEYANGQEAVDAFTSHDVGYYDVILMDVRMPVLDGLEATRRIRKLDRPDALSVPIFAMTADSFDEEKRATADAGMDAHLSKPVDPPLLFAVLYRFLSADQ